MFWRIENLTDEESHILIEDLTKPNRDDWEPVGMGFPPALAERLVKLHNDTVKDLLKGKTNESIGNQPGVGSH